MHTDLVEARRALVAEIVAMANSIIQGEMDPYRGAKLLWELHMTLEHVTKDLLDFVGLASEWEDAPDHRDAIEREIVVTADRLRAKRQHPG